jgi:uncharacterized protein YcbK (DUF882 family)
MKYFTIEELTTSKIAQRLKIDNKPSAEVINNLTKLVDNVLDPLREAWGKSITVNSGYRSPELNKAVKGSKTSWHLQGCAADITAGSPHLNEKLYNKIRELKLPYCELIDEHQMTWVHVAYNGTARPENVKKQ